MHGNTFSNVAPWALTTGVVLIAGLAWFVGSSLSALGSGWHKLQNRFRASGPFNGDQRSFQTGVMRWQSRYNHSLRLGANQDGMYISAMWLARMQHPPLFVPWSEISAMDQPRLLRQGTLFMLGRKEQVPLWVPQSTGDWLRGFMPSVKDRVERFYSEKENPGLTN